MKKTLLFILAALIILTGCAQGAKYLEGGDDTPLLTADGDVLLTIKDYNRLVCENELQHELLGQDRSTQDELFTTAAEYALCARFAEDFGAQADIETLYSEYDSYLSDLKTNLDNTTLNYLSELKKELDMDDDALRDWTVYETYKQRCCEDLIENISKNYSGLTDTAAMEEAVLSNLQQLADMYEINCSFEGFENKTFDFKNILKL